jgi:hypothetical protein
MENVKVFLSHTSKDKPIVEKFALALRAILGQENVFYDSWSIQPGDGIVDKMNQGLSDCDYFFFFVSRNSLTSNMVKLEWQNALASEAKKTTRFIPIKLDDCEMPAILMQKLYIDVSNIGLDAGVRQVVDVINGNNTFRETNLQFHNLNSYILSPSSDHKMQIEIRAKAYMEPISRYLVMLGNENAQLSCTSDIAFQNGRSDPMRGKEGELVYPYSIAVERATTPNFPFRFIIDDEKPIHLQGIFHAVGESEYEQIPAFLILPDAIFHFGSDLEIPFQVFSI